MNNFDQFLAYVRWIWYGGILYLHFIILSYIFYCFAYPVRGLLRRFKILKLNRFLYITSINLFIFNIYYFIIHLLKGFDFINWPYTIGLFVYSALFWWIFLDDDVIKHSDDYGEIWWQEVNNINPSKMNWWQKFVTAYRWGVIRNPAWNYHSVFNTQEGEVKVLKAKGELIKNEVIQPVMSMATLKWEDENGNFTNNQGKYISNKHTVWGKMFVWYKQGKRLYWRYSYVGETPKWLYIILSPFTKREWMEVHLGTNDVRYTFRWKLKSGEVKY